MDYKWIELPCPTCEFTHQFKRECWWEKDGPVYIGLYVTDDSRSRKDCRQELIYGTGEYNAVTSLLEK